MLQGGPERELKENEGKNLKLKDKNNKLDKSNKILQHP